MEKSVCLLYASCIPVKGATHSIICDLQRQNYVQIPSGLYEILTLHRGKSVDAIKAAYDHQYDAIIDNYFKTLIQNEFAFFTDTPELFPQLSLEWDSPMEVSNAILDWSSTSDYDIYAVLDQLSTLHCKFIQFRFYNQISIEELTRVLNYLDHIESNSIGIDFILPHLETNKVEEFKALFSRYKRLNNISIHACPHDKQIMQMGTSKYLILVPTAITSEKSCGLINKSLFSIHMQTFTEAQKHNTCLNGKISVDKSGMIRNCPSMPTAFGHVSQTSLFEALQQTAFKKYWKVNKDQIDICKACEFRYICTDCRAYTVDPENDRSKPLKCGYDPYTGQWNAPNNFKKAAKAVEAV